MLPQKYRVKREQEFASIYRRGRKLSSPTLQISYIPTDQNISRFGFVVSKKHAPRIVDRNRLKRILRAEIAHCRIKISPGHDVVISARAVRGKLDTDAVRFELVQLLKKAKLLP